MTMVDSRRSRMLRLPPMLRPRLTVRYLFFSSLAIYILYCFLSGSPLLASNLPRYTGPYAVGTIDIEAPCAQRNINPFRLKGSGGSAFPLDTVLFSLFYPATNHRISKPRHNWVPKPISVTAEGYLRFGHVNNSITNKIVTAGLWSVAGGIRIPAAVDAPIAQLVPALEVQDEKYPDIDRKITDGFPVLIFSHGFASSRTDYSHYLAELASRGYIVAAIEHRDGSGPGSIVMREGSDNRVAFPIRLSDLDDHPDLNASSFKQAQLNFRQVEVEETIRVLGLINHGGGDEVYQQSPRNEGQNLNAWTGRLNMNEVTMSGHSFGATLALQALKSSPNLPFRGGIALDPGKSSGPLNDDISVPLLVIHSNSWSRTHSIFYGRPHFDVVRDLVQGVLDRGKGAWFMTSLGTSHPSVTDAPLIEPLLLSWTTGATIDVKEGMEQYVKASYEFLRYQRTGQRTGLLAQHVSHSEYKDKEGVESVLDKGYRRYWQVHVAPES